MPDGLAIVLGIVVFSAIRSLSDIASRLVVADTGPWLAEAVPGLVATGIFLGQLDEALSRHCAGVFIAKVAAPCPGFVTVALGSLRS